MSRHSKNNCSRGVFTYHERQSVADFGTQQKRLGRDSQKEAEACCLCLKPVRFPMACPKGHLFCKECIYDSLMSQKKELKRQLKVWEEQQKVIEAEAERQKVRDEDARIQHFARIEGSILPPSGEEIAREAAKLNSSAPSSIGSTALIVPVRPEDHNALVGHEANNKQNDPKQLRAFWLPSMTPDAGPATLQRPSEETKCPMGHIMRLKQLIKVDFTPVKGVDQTDDTKFGRFMCGTCMRGLNSAAGLILARPCGHVTCKSCFDKFGKASTKNDASADKMAQCPTCNMKLTSDKDIVSLQASGSSFAAGGGEEKVAKKEVVVPRFG